MNGTTDLDQVTQPGDDEGDLVVVVGAAARVGDEAAHAEDVTEHGADPRCRRPRDLPGATNPPSIHGSEGSHDVELQGLEPWTSSMPWKRSTT